MIKPSRIERLNRLVPKISGLMPNPSAAASFASVANNKTVSMIMIIEGGE
jgi:hypothetical protein